MNKRKLIAVDVDEVFSPLIKHMLPWYNTKHGTSHSINDYGMRSYAIEDNFGGTLEHWLEEFVNYIKDSWEHDSAPIEHAVDSIKQIMHYHDVFFMTARDTEVHDITERFLKNHMGGHFTKLLSLNYADKGDALKAEGAHLLIDDSVKNIESAQKAGIEGWLFGGYPHHESVSDLFKVGDWREVCQKLAV